MSISPSAALFLGCFMVALHLVCSAGASFDPSCQQSGKPLSPAEVCLKGPDFKVIVILRNKHTNGSVWVFKSHAADRNFIIWFCFLCPIILPAFPFEVFTHHLYIWGFRGILQQFTAYLTAEQDTLGKKRKKKDTP